MKNMNYSYQPSHGTASRAYASPGDFCRIFNEDMDSLYSLALVLTRNHEIAQQCVLAALDDCTGSAVFPEWVRSFSRRAIIKNAIRLAGPALPGAGGTPEAAQEIANELDTSSRSYFLLPQFDGFVFVISVLERYTVRECAALLGSSVHEVEQARVRALQRISGYGRDLAPVTYVGVSHAAPNPALALDQR
jgi:hypothetical protein